MKVLEFIEKTIGKSLAVVIIKLCDAVKCIAEFLSAYSNAKEKKENDAKKKQHNNKIDKIANSGTIDDLLDIGNGI